MKNVDDRKRRMTLGDLLTMTSGLKWDDDGFLTGNSQNDASLLEASDDWLQYVIDKPMAAEPSKVWNYSSGDAQLFAYIFQKETGRNIDDFGQKYLFAPLGIRHEWKRSYLGAVDTEGGLYLSGSDLTKIGYLYLSDGMWDQMLATVQFDGDSRWRAKQINLHSTPAIEWNRLASVPDERRLALRYWWDRLQSSVVGTFREKEEHLGRVARGSAGAWQFEEEPTRRVAG